MTINVSEKLEELAKFFPEGLFVVGGYVRNGLLGIDCFDVDLASAVDIGKVVQRLEGSKFKVKIKNLKLGAVLIECEDQKFEYTAFRKESYGLGGKHRPSQVEHTGEVEVDAKRRDFSINSVYFNVNEKKDC